MLVFSRTGDIQMSKEKPNLDIQFIRMKEVSKKTGLSKSYIYQLQAKGFFPKSVPIIPSISARAWVLSEVNDWMESLITARNEEAV